MANEWQIGLIIIIAAIVIMAAYVRLNKGTSFFDRLFKGLILIGGSFAVIFGFIMIFDDASSDIGDGRDYDYESKYNYSDETGGDVSFKGSQTGYTGPCKECDCPAYDRSPDGICECGHSKTKHKWHN